MRQSTMQHLYKKMNIIRFSLGVTGMDKIRNEYIRGTAQVQLGRLGEKEMQD